ncbi:MAG: hypothetical protein AAFU78_12610, partial [Cyanobacteria bacterium J06633_2]
AEAIARRPLLGLMRLGRLVSILNLTLLATTLWNLSKVGSAELHSTDQRAIAPQPISPLFKTSRSG